MSSYDYDLFVIGAGSVVTKDVPDFALIIGNPGKVVGWVNKKGFRIKFKADGISECENYKLNKKNITYLGK